MTYYYYNGVFKELFILRTTYSYRTCTQTFEIGEDWRENYLFPISNNDFSKKVKEIKKDPVEGSCLYFDVTSKFPRFKLQDSNFKRCIKIEKADQTVVNQDVIQSLCRENKSQYIIVEENDVLCLISTDLTIHNKRNNENILDAINRQSKLFPSKHVIYAGERPLTVDNKKTTSLVTNIIDGIYDNIIYDNDLDRVINKKLESLDQDTITSINEMLESRDNSIVSMGLKLLPNYNILEYPSTISTILRLNNYRIVQSSVWNSTAIKQLCSSINYQPPSTDSFPGCLRGIFDKNITYSDEDKKFTKSLIKSKITDVINQIYNSELKDICERYNIKFYAEAS